MESGNNSNKAYKTIKLLLDDGAEVNLQDVNGWSALYAAIGRRNTEVVKLLLEHNALVDLKNGKNALTLVLLRPKK